MNARLKDWIIACLDNDNGYALGAIQNEDVLGEWTNSYDYVAADNTKYGIWIDYNKAGKRHATLFANNTDVEDAIEYRGSREIKDGIEYRTSVASKLDSLVTDILMKLAQGGNYKLVIINGGMHYKIIPVINEKNK